MSKDAISTIKLDIWTSNILALCQDDNFSSKWTTACREQGDDEEEALRLQHK